MGTTVTSMNEFHRHVVGTNRNDCAETERLNVF